jgi:uncharacterized UBP type Zn finger protein
MATVRFEKAITEATSPTFCWNELMSTTCTHLDSIQVTELPDTIAGCEDCLATGGRWVHLRMCQSCGRIGCCDSSPRRHASAHARTAQHPIARSAEPGERWSWCYVDNLAFLVQRP